VGSGGVRWGPVRYFDVPVFYGTSTQDRSTCAILHGGEELALADEDSRQVQYTHITDMIIIHNEHEHAATNNKYALLA